MDNTMSEESHECGYTGFIPAFVAHGIWRIYPAYHKPGSIYVGDQIDGLWGFFWALFRNY
ncbi:MAG: hypothetical protein STSR0009_17170 [Methanoregula sp.]